MGDYDDLDVGALAPAFQDPDHFLFYVLAVFAGSMAWEVFKQTVSFDGDVKVTIKTIVVVVAIFAAGWYVGNRWPEDAEE